MWLRRSGCMPDILGQGIQSHHREREEEIDLERENAAQDVEPTLRRENWHEHYFVTHPVCMSKTLTTLFKQVSDVSSRSSYPIRS